MREKYYLKGEDDFLKYRNKQVYIATHCACFKLVGYNTASETPWILSDDRDIFDQPVDSYSRCFIYIDKPNNHKYEKNWYHWFWDADCDYKVLCRYDRAHNGHTSRTGVWHSYAEPVSEELQKMLEDGEKI